MPTGYAGGVGFVSRSLASRANRPARSSIWRSRHFLSASAEKCVVTVVVGSAESTGIPSGSRQTPLPTDCASSELLTKASAIPAVVNRFQKDRMTTPLFREIAPSPPIATS